MVSDVERAIVAIRLECHAFSNRFFVEKQCLGIGKWYICDRALVDYLVLG